MQLEVSIKQLFPLWVLYLSSRFVLKIVSNPPVYPPEYQHCGYRAWQIRNCLHTAEARSYIPTYQLTLSTPLIRNITRNLIILLMLLLYHTLKTPNDNTEIVTHSISNLENNTLLKYRLLQIFELSRNFNFRIFF